MVLRATRTGLDTARRHPELAATLWLANLSLALAAGVPGWLALRSAVARLPEADALVRGDSLSLWLDLVELRPGLLPGLLLSAIGVALLGLLAGALVTGGVLEVLTSADERPLAHRFGRGAGRFFARLLRAGLAAAVAGGLLAALAAGPLLAASGKLREAGREVLAHATTAGGLALAGLLLLFVALAHDAARIRLVRDDAQRVLPALRFGFGAVLRRPLRWAGTWALNALLLLAAFVAYSFASGAMRSALALLLAQQAFVLARCGLRVALWGGELELLEGERAGHAPTPAGSPAPETPSDAVPQA